MLIDSWLRLKIYILCELIIRLDIPLFGDELIRFHLDIEDELDRMLSY